MLLPIFCFQFLYLYETKLVKLGRFKNFWGHENLKPIWWPRDIPFVCISNLKKFRLTKEKLINIVLSYQRYYDVKPLSKDKAKLDITTSTPKKRLLIYTASDISPLCKRVKVLESSFSQLSNTSYFGGLLDTPSTNHFNLLASIPTCNKKISPATKKTCLKELLTDVTINAFV